MDAATLARWVRIEETDLARVAHISTLSPMLLYARLIVVFVFLTLAFGCDTDSCADAACDERFARVLAEGHE